MTDTAPPAAAPDTKEIPSNDLARMVAATETTTAVRKAQTPSAKDLRRKLLGAVLLAAIGVGASIMSCIGQSFSYRQAHALEGIEQQLKEIRSSCTLSPHEAAR